MGKFTENFILKLSHLVQKFPSSIKVHQLSELLDKELSETMKTLILLAFVALIVINSVLCVSSADITPVDLKCEYLRNPSLVDNPHPRLGWTFKANDPKKQNLTQKAYQILVATDRQKLDKSVGDLWKHKQSGER